MENENIPAAAQPVQNQMGNAQNQMGNAQNQPAQANAIVNPFAPGGAANPNGQAPAAPQFNFFPAPNQPIIFDEEQPPQPIEVGRYVFVQMPNQPARTGIITAVEGDNYTVRVIQNQQDVDHPEQVANPVILEQVARAHLVEQPLQPGLVIGGEFVPFQPIILGAPAPAIENLFHVAPAAGAGGPAVAAPGQNNQNQINWPAIPQHNPQNNLQFPEVPQHQPLALAQNNQNNNAMSINTLQSENNNFSNMEGGLRRKRRTRGRKSKKSRKSRRRSRK